MLSRLGQDFLTSVGCDLVQQPATANSLPTLACRHIRHHCWRRSSNSGSCFPPERLTSRARKSASSHLRRQAYTTLLLAGQTGPSESLALTRGVRPEGTPWAISPILAVAEDIQPGSLSVRIVQHGGRAMVVMLSSMYRRSMCGVSAETHPGRYTAVQLSRVAERVGLRPEPGCRGSWREVSDQLDPQVQLAIPVARRSGHLDLRTTGSLASDPHMSPDRMQPKIELSSHRRYGLRASEVRPAQMSREPVVSELAWLESI